MADIETKKTEDMSVEEVCNWIKTRFDETVATKFEEQKINGKGLVLLATKGTKDQLEVCGLPLVGDQMKLLENVEMESAESDGAIHCTSKARMIKPSTKKIDCDLHKRIYNAKKKAVRAAVIAKWPGNKLPNFKKDTSQLKVLSQLVDELEDDCTYLKVGFNKEAIRQHILDILNERRRHVRKGHDYTKVDKPKAVKKKSGQVATSKLDETATAACVQLESSDGGDTEDLCSSDSQSNSSAASPSTSNQALSEDNEENITVDSAKIVVACAFNEVRETDVKRAQLQSAAKTLKVSVKASESRSREVLMLNVAQALIEKGYVKIPPNKKISRRDIQILKPF